MSFKLRGYQKTINKLISFGNQGESVVKTITGVTANEIATNAAKNLSSYSDVDKDGHIAQSINTYPSNNGFSYSISVNEVPMAAYVEFGTGRFVEVADEWINIAWQFYVNGRGYMYPRPYLYPAYVEGRKQYEIDLNRGLNELIKRYNYK